MSTPRRLILVVILAFAVALVFVLKGARTGDRPGNSAAAVTTPSGAVAPAVPPTYAVPQTSAAGATRAVAVPRLVDVGADKCIPCKAMAPILEELRREYAGRLRVDFIDARKYPDQAAPFNVYGIPTQIFFDPAGRELHRHEGFISKDDILATWRRLGFPLTPPEKG